MTLTEYFSIKRGNARELADKLGISPSYLSQMATGRSPIPPETCVRIEQVTEGRVTRKCLKENWLAIWPELANSRRKSQP